MTPWQLVFQWLLLGRVVIGAFIGTGLSNMAVQDGKVYIGAENYIYVLNASDLKEIQKVETCEGDCVSNRNAVLLVNKHLNQLITCGHGNSGVCKIYSLDNLTEVDTSENMITRQGDKYLDVSSDNRKPVTFILNENGTGFFFGITREKASDKFFMASYILNKNGFVTNVYHQSLKLRKINGVEVNYEVYFKAGFQLNEFVYFFTNQKYEVGDGAWTSKIIRLCQNEQDHGEQKSYLWSYTDIPIECQNDEEVFNLIQDVVLIKPGELLMKNLSLSSDDWIIAATFTMGSDPEYQKSASAICLYKVNEIDQHIMDAKRDFVTCQDSQFKGEEYLPDFHKGACLSPTLYNNVTEDVLCGDLEVYRYIIGGMANNISSSPVYTLESTEHGFLGKIQATVIGEYIVLYVGTSGGRLLKLNVNSQKAEFYEEKLIDDGHPITAIHVEDGGKIEYIMSERKLFRYETVNCDKYSSCAATMGAKNPLCGWCVYENKSTFKDNSSCPFQQSPGHWLSPFTNCLRIDINPKGIPVNKTEYVYVSFIGVEPALINGYTYTCTIKAGTEQKQTKGKMMNLNCLTPHVTEHREGVVLLGIKDTTLSSSDAVPLANTELLFYDCRHYKRCGDCVGDDRAKCSWNSHETRCVPLDESVEFYIQNATDCPKFKTEETYYLPSGVSQKLTFNVTNLVNSTFEYNCRLNGTEFKAVKESDTRITCNLSATSGGKETQEYTVEILYGTTSLDGENTVVVYNCSKLGDDCSKCRSLKYNNANYQCDWCSGSCIYAVDLCSDTCDAPTVTQVIPNTAGLNGNIIITITGQELGSRFEDVENITLAGVPCIPQNDRFLVSKRVTCLAGKSQSIMKGNVTVKVKNQQNSNAIAFTYEQPGITNVIPIKGPQIGGTRLTIRGQCLGVGTRKVKVNVINATNQNQECTKAEVMPYVHPNTNLNSESVCGDLFHIECNTPGNELNSTLKEINLTLDGGTTVTHTMTFMYVDNPSIEHVIPQKGIASGGNRLTVTGTHFKNANKGSISVTCRSQDCDVTSDTEMICAAPPLCSEDRDRLNSILNTTRKRRNTDSSVSSKFVTIDIYLHLDGVERKYSINYFIDPSFTDFSEDAQVKVFDSEDRKLVIKGTNLNLVAGKGDVVVTIGVDKCVVIELREMDLICVAPTNQPSTKGGNLPEVNVSIGNVHKNVGYLKYVAIQEQLAKTWIIIAAVIGGLLALVVGIVVALIVKYKQKSRKMQVYQKKMEEQEMEIVNTFREEFADMHTSMFTVNNSLIEQGCPFHHYQRYVFNVLFPADTMESHPLLQEPVLLKAVSILTEGMLKFFQENECFQVVTGSDFIIKQTTDCMRQKLKRGMEEFENLIFNKYFLLSLISSMEEQKKFGLKEKANMCGYICTILLGRMEYLQEILVDLLGNLVQESAGKKNQKVLFRRCETITEKLLSNWLSLCLYPHLKSQSGCPLYLLYKATQLHMEAGPIDALTHDAKYTLSEEKLLKKYSQQSKKGSDEPTFEAKCLTLNVVVDNCRDIKVCRVLDCDTITQVKDKCLTQIYMNYPASNLTVKPEELELEWHAGTSGCLRLRDEDNTSKPQRNWVRLNTLAHYNVQDGSNMALVDPQIADASQEQDYVNLAQVQLSCATSQTSEESTDAMTASLVDSSRDRSNLRYWHLVKPEEATLAQGRSLIAELYLNRLLTFKQSILENIRAIFDTVLKEDILPPHVHYLYHLLNELAEKNKVESDILHTWKSEVYPVRIWANLMKKPSIVFDIKSPPYVDTSMDVISQVFIECFSLESHKFSKDSATHKMIFNKEMSVYKEKVKQFYKEITVMESQPIVLRKYLEEVNKLQQQHANFNKMSALHKLYQQIEPYKEEVIENLTMNREAQRLHLDKKLEEVTCHMEEEEE